MDALSDDRIFDRGGHFCGTKVELNEKGVFFGRSGLHELRFDGDVSGEYEGTHQGGNHETEGKVEKCVLIWKQKLKSCLET